MDGAGGTIRVILANDARLQFLWAALALVGTLLFGAIVILLVDRWRKRAAGPSITATDQLSHFRELLDKGTISRDEFDQIKTRLAGELRKEFDAKVDAAAVAASTESTPNAPGSPGLPSSPGTINAPHADLPPENGRRID